MARKVTIPTIEIPEAELREAIKERMVDEIMRNSKYNHDH